MLRRCWRAANISQLGQVSRVVGAAAARAEPGAAAMHSFSCSQSSAGCAQHIGSVPRWGRTSAPPLGSAFRHQLQAAGRAFASHNSPNSRDKPFLSRQRTSGVVNVATPSSSFTGPAAAPASTSSSQPADQQQQQQQAVQPLVFSCGAFVLPHPEKMAKGGEDWYFVADNKRALGVADGVGGWAEVGVDAGAYARMLMGSARDAADLATSAASPAVSIAASASASVSSWSSASSNGGNGSNGSSSASGSTQVLAAPAPAPKLSAQDILEAAYRKTTVLGSSTACIIALNGSTLCASNLGDSGFMVVRDGDVLMATNQQQHSFNFPFQIGGADAMGDHPRVADRYEVQLVPGDILVVGTDGLWDNVFHDEMLSVVKYCQELNMQPDKAAHVLGHYARHRAADRKFASPFAYSAYQAGIKYLGGKMDDITVIIAYVEPELQQTRAKL